METPEDMEARLLALSQAIKAQEAALSELTKVTETQADTVAGAILVLRAIIDVVMSEEQRTMLEEHLALTVPDVAPQTRRRIIEALLA